MSPASTVLAISNARHVTQGILLDGMKMLEVTGPEGDADISPVVTTENLGELSRHHF
jgi:hypothetical protein